MTATLLDVLLLVVGIIIILFGGDYLVRGATAVARRTGVPSLLIGLTIVAFGTSAPEMVVSVFASLAGSPGLAVGNIVGSNIANIFLVLGVPALIAAMGTAAKGVRTNALYRAGRRFALHRFCAGTGRPALRVPSACLRARSSLP